MRKLLLLLWLIFFSAAAHAYTFEPPSVGQAFKLTVGVGKGETVLFHWQISPESYLYQERIHFKVLSPPSVSIAKIGFPSSQVVDDGAFGRYSVYSNEVTVPVLLKEAANQRVKLQVSYQGCSKLGLCYAPVQREVTVNFKQGVLATQVKSESLGSAQSKISQILKQDHLGMVLLIFLGLGLLLAFTPCILPIIPILSAIIVGHGHKLSSSKAFLLSLTYVLSMSITYAAAGVVVSLLGENLQALLQAPWLIVLFSLLFVVLALPMFGLFELQLPERWRTKLTAISSHQKGGTYLGVIAMGVLSTLIVSPCVTPPLVGTLIFMANSGSIWLGALALFALGFGMGIPLLIIGTVGGKFLPKAGAWMEGIKKFFGFVMLALALYLILRNFNVSIGKNTTN